MRRMRTHALALALLGASIALAQSATALDSATKTSVVAAIQKALENDYVFPEVGAKMSADLAERLRRGDYGAMNEGPALAAALTEHLQAVSHDKHLRVRYSKDVLPRREDRREPTPEEIARFRENAARDNFGFRKVEMLAGNIGYVDFRGFLPPAMGAETAIAAMNFLGNADAVIFDLRQNGGGDPAMVALLTTFLFAPEGEQHLNDLYFRPRNETRQWWTLPFVPGKRLAGKPAYVLTSKYTFSAAEEFTYNLKNLKRATIVGEVTGGGAHPGGMVRLDDHFSAFVPTGRAINPVSKTNWEGTGVKPDIEVPKEKALQTAHIAAIEKLIESAKDDRRKEQLKRAMEEARK